jgi:hypothetical protein
VGHLFIRPLLLFLAYPLIATLLDFSAAGLPGAWTLLWQYALCMQADDAAFYWSHRLLHHRWLYKRIHKRHHEAGLPSFEPVPIVPSLCAGQGLTVALAPLAVSALGHDRGRVVPPHRGLIWQRPAHCDRAASAAIPRDALLALCGEQALAVARRALGVCAAVPAVALERDQVHGLRTRT